VTTPALAETVKGKGRHYRVPQTGDLVPSVTNILGALSKPALPRWAAKSVAETAYTMRHALAEMDQEEAVEVLKGSPWRSSTRAANRGTAIHSLVEATVQGLPLPELVGQAKDFYPSVEQFLSDYEVVPLHTEVTVFGDGYAGTCDFIGTIDGARCLIDWKTGSRLYPEVALQLSALWAAEGWAAAVETEGAPPEGQDEVVAADADYGGEDTLLLGVLFSPDGYKIKRVKEPQETYEVFGSLLEVWKWQNSGSGPLAAWS
jgi:hypothetical protein